MYCSLNLHVSPLKVAQLCTGDASEMAFTTSWIFQLMCLTHQVQIDYTSSITVDQFLD